MKIYRISAVETPTLIIPDMEEVYIRFGEIPKDEQSVSWNEGYNPNIKAKGVSVFRSYYDPKTDYYVIPATGDDSVVYTPPSSLSDRTAYLVTGDEVGEGSSGEPVLRNVRIVKKIDPRQMIEADNPQNNLLDEEINVDLRWDRNEKKEYKDSPSKDISPTTKAFYEVALKMGRKESINASLIEDNGLQFILPKGYIKEGDQYIYRI